MKPISTNFLTQPVFFRCHKRRDFLVETFRNPLKTSQFGFVFHFLKDLEAASLCRQSFLLDKTRFAIGFHQILSVELGYNCSQWKNPHNQEPFVVSLTSSGITSSYDKPQVSLQTCPYSQKQ